MGAAFKFMSVADLYWHPIAWIFDFELVMSAWIVISLSAALYLLGLFRLPHDIRGDSIGVIRFTTALSFLGLAAYLAVGLYGPVKPSGKVWENILAFAPPRFDGQSDSRLGPVLVHGGVKYALDFQRAMSLAAEENKPVFLDFTGVNCTNCRKMEQGPLSNPSVTEKLKRMICVQVYCDQVPHVSDPGERARLLRQNLALQEWFGDTSLPSYAVVEADTALMSRPPDTVLLSDTTGYDPDVEAFSRFLEAGIARWNQTARAGGKMLSRR
jgi:thiol:disulfide interchange protein DsbD